MGGLSYGWWVAKHNAHHAHPNDLESDPDVRAGALVFDAGQATGRRGLAAWTTRHQAGLFFPFLLCEAVNLHVSSVRRLFAPGSAAPARRRRCCSSPTSCAYVALLVVTLTWQQAWCSSRSTRRCRRLPGCSFAPGHKGMPMLDAEQAADPLLRQVLTSRNVRGGPFVDSRLGGLNYQIEHHLFPSMPRPNLRARAAGGPPVLRASAGSATPRCRSWSSYAAVLRTSTRSAPSSAPRRARAAPRPL